MNSTTIPTSLTFINRRKLPKRSTFYASYCILSTLSSSAVSETSTCHSTKYTIVETDHNSIQHVRPYLTPIVSFKEQDTNMVHFTVAKPSNVVDMCSYKNQFLIQFISPNQLTITDTFNSENNIELFTVPENNEKEWRMQEYCMCVCEDELYVYRVLNTCSDYEQSKYNSKMTRFRSELWSFNLIEKTWKLLQDGSIEGKPYLKRMHAVHIPYIRKGYMLIVGEPLVGSLFGNSTFSFTLNLDNMSWNPLELKRNLYTSPCISASKGLFMFSNRQSLILLNSDNLEFFYECRVYESDPYLKRVGDVMNTVSLADCSIHYNDREYGVSIPVHRIIVDRNQILEFSDDVYTVVTPKCNRYVLESFVRFLYNRIVPLFETESDEKLFSQLLVEFNVQIPPNPVQSVISSMRDIWNNRLETYDLIIECGVDEDHEQLHVHKAVLSVFDYFSAMINFQDPSDNILIMEHDPKVMSQVIEYLYTNEIEVLDSNCLSLYFIAQELLLTDLLERVKPCIVQNITLESVLVVLSFTDLTEDESIRIQLIEFFKKGGFQTWMLFKLSEEFEEVEQHYSHILNAIEKEVDYASYEQKLRNRTLV
jgi:hypothetical protein